MDLLTIIYGPFYVLYNGVTSTTRLELVALMLTIFAVCVWSVETELCSGREINKKKRCM